MIQSIVNELENDLRKGKGLKGSYKIDENFFNGDINKITHIENYFIFISESDKYEIIKQYNNKFKDAGFPRGQIERAALKKLVYDKFNEMWLTHFINPNLSISNNEYIEFNFSSNILEVILYRM